MRRRLAEADLLDADQVQRVLADALERDDARRLAETQTWPEKEFERNVVDWARRFGWLTVHFGGNLSGRAYYDAAGFPDLLLIHPTGLVWFRELKASGGKLSTRQQRWYDRLAEAGANVAVWWPRDWPDIVNTLSFGRGVAQ